MPSEAPGLPLLPAQRAGRGPGLGVLAQRPPHTLAPLSLSFRRQGQPVLRARLSRMTRQGPNSGPDTGRQLLG